MDDILNDLEAGISSNIPHNSNKKIRKRKELDSLLKFRSKKNTSNDLLRTSEDELFLPVQKPPITKLRLSRYRHCRKYSQHILSFVLVCIFIIVCVGLTYANIQLKNEVHTLTLRIYEIETKSNNTSSTIEQIKVRLNLLEHWNFSLIYDQLQKLQIQMLINDNDVSRHIERRSTRFPKIMNRLNKLEHQSENMINESIIEWYDRLNSLRNDIQSTNQSIKIQELMIQLEQLTNLVYNSSDKTSVILTKFQSDLDQLRSRMEQCKCSKELIHLGSSVVDSEQLQQNMVVKSNIISSSSTKITATSFERLNNQDKQIENDVEQIVNEPSVID